MEREYLVLLLLLFAMTGLVVAVAGRRMLFAALPLLVTLNGVALPTPVGAVRLDQAAALLIGAGLVARYLLEPFPVAFDTTMRWMLALFLVSLYSSAFASPDRRYSLAQLVNYFSAIWVYGVVLLCTRDMDDVDQVVDRFVLAGIVGGLVGILAFVLGISGFPVGGANIDVRMTGLAFGSYGTMREPNIFGNFCQIFFVFGIAVLQLPSGARRALPFGRMVLLLLVSSFGLLLSFTRGAWIGAFVGLIAVTGMNVIVFGARVRISRILAPVVVALIAGVIVWNSSPGAEEFMKDKLQNLVNKQSDNAAIRLLLYARALENVRVHPWLGSGTFSFAALSVPGINVRDMGNRHDLWLGNYVMLALHDTGVVGLAIFLAIIASALRPALRAARSLARRDPYHAVRLSGLIAAFASLLVSFLTTSGFTFGYPWLLLGIIGAYVQHSKRAPPEGDDAS